VFVCGYFFAIGTLKTLVVFSQQKCSEPALIEKT